MDNAQLMKGILEGCILSIIARGETYGYEIISELEQVGFENLGEGTLYPLLTRLDKNGLIVCRRAKSPLGPIRKYYSITTEGMESQLNGSYRELFAKVTTYLMTENFQNDFANERVADFFELLLTAQGQGTPIEHIAGKDTERFCRDLFSDYT